MDWLGFTLARMALQRAGGGVWKTVLVFAAFFGLCIVLLLSLIIGWLFWGWLSAWTLWDLALWDWLAGWWRNWWSHYPPGWRWWMAFPVTAAWVILCVLNGIFVSDAVHMARFRPETLRLARWAEKGEAAMAKARREGRGPDDEADIHDVAAYKDEALVRDVTAYIEAVRKNDSRMARSAPYAYAGGGLLAIFTGFLSSPLHGRVRDAVLSYQVANAEFDALMGEQALDAQLVGLVFYLAGVAGFAFAIWVALAMLSQWTVDRLNTGIPVPPDHSREAAWWTARWTALKNLVMDR